MLLKPTPMSLDELLNVAQSTRLELGEFMKLVPKPR